MQILDYETNKKIIESSEYTRLPVYKNSIDNELGTLHLKNSHSFLEKLRQKKMFKIFLQKHILFHNQLH